MYSFSSASIRCAPRPRSMISGSPPTAPKARTGLLTPPTRISSARWKMARDRLQGRWVTRGSLAGSEPPGCIFGVIGQHDGCTGTLDGRQDFEHDALFIEPAMLDCCFDHRILAAYVVGRHRHMH